MRPGRSHSVADQGPGQEITDLRDARLFTPGLLLGLVLLAAFIGFVVLHAPDERAFLSLLEHARPLWLFAGALSQLLTYFCAAGVWKSFITHAGHSVRLRHLVGAAVSRLTVDQIAPSFGVSGRMAVIQRLRAQGIPFNLALGATLFDLFTNYAAHALALLGAVALLWTRQDLRSRLLAATTPFMLLAAVFPLVLIWTLRHATGLARMQPFRHAAELVQRVPFQLLWSLLPLVAGVSLQLSIFLLDGATLLFMHRAVGIHVQMSTAFVSVVVAEMAATLSMIPGGIGSFEAVCVGMLTVQGTPLQPALTATILLRGFTLWLPLLPGLWFSTRGASWKMRLGHLR